MVEVVRIRLFVSRHRLALTFAPVLAVALVWSGLRVGEFIGHQTFEARLTRLVSEAPDGATIDLRDATTFAWQRGYVFGAYLPGEHIDETLGFKAFAPWDFVIPSNDGDQLLVLVGDGHVRGFMNLSRLDGPFTFDAESEDGFSADQAVRLVHRPPPEPGQSSWPWLSNP